jgi:hypothetical protein
MLISFVQFSHHFETTYSGSFSNVSKSAPVAASLATTAILSNTQSKILLLQLSVRDISYVGPRSFPGHQPELDPNPVPEFTRTSDQYGAFTGDTL